MKPPTVRDMERVLRERYPEVESFPLLRTLADVSWELDIPVWALKRSLRDCRAVLWKRKGKVYIPPDIYERWRAKGIT